MFFRKHRFIPPDELTINAQWVSYSKSVFAGFEPSVSQYLGTKQAFYTGFMCMLKVNMLIADLHEDDGVEALESLRKEAIAWFEQNNRKANTS